MHYILKIKQTKRKLSIPERYADKGDSIRIGDDSWFGPLTNLSSTSYACAPQGPSENGHIQTLFFKLSVLPTLLSKFSRFLFIGLYVS